METVRFFPSRFLKVLKNLMVAESSTLLWHSLSKFICLPTISNIYCLYFVMIIDKRKLTKSCGTSTVNHPLIPSGRHLFYYAMQQHTLLISIHKLSHPQKNTTTNWIYWSLNVVRRYSYTISFQKKMNCFITNNTVKCINKNIIK